MVRRGEGSGGQGWGHEDAEKTTLTEEVAFALTNAIGDASAALFSLGRAVAAVVEAGAVGFAAAVDAEPAFLTPTQGRARIEIVGVLLFCLCIPTEGRRTAQYAQSRTKERVSAQDDKGLLCMEALSGLSLDPNESSFRKCDVTKT